MTLSAGIAAWKTNMKMESLIIAADRALYQAKNAGRNQVVLAVAEQE